MIVDQFFYGLSVTSGIHVPVITSSEIVYNFVRILYKRVTWIEGSEAGVKWRWLALNYCLRNGICGIQISDELWYTMSCEGYYYHPGVGDYGSHAPILLWIGIERDQ